MTRRRASETGTVVVEALVAALIVAATVGAAFETIGGSAARAHETAQRQRAMLVAASQMAGIGATVPLSAGATRGLDGDLAWSIELNADAEFGPGLMAVTVRVGPAAGGMPLATLRSLRLGRA